MSDFKVSGESDVLEGKTVWNESIVSTAEEGRS